MRWLSRDACKRRLARAGLCARAQRCRPFDGLQFPRDSLVLALYCKRDGDRACQQGHAPPKPIASPLKARYLYVFCGHGTHKRDLAQLGFPGTAARLPFHYCTLAAVLGVFSVAPMMSMVLGDCCAPQTDLAVRHVSKDDTAILFTVTSCRLVACECKPAY